MPLLCDKNLKLKQILILKYMILKGYPECLNFDEFERRFSMFLINNSNDSLQHQQQQHLMHSLNDDHRQACLNLIKNFDLDPAYYRLGTTQVCLT